MKFTKYFMPFAALALLASCSNDNISDPNVDQQKPGQLIDGKVYAAFNIAMPSVTGSRAEVLADGDAAEYAVKDGTILIFKQDGSSEGDYVYVTSGEVTDMAWEMNGSPTDQITSDSKTAVAAFEGMELDLEGSDVYYALVVLNKNSLGLSLTKNVSKFSDWQLAAQGTNATVNNIIGTTTAGLTMTNAPQLVGNASETLVQIDKTKISTVSSSNLTPAATIYVQRIAAKIEIKPVSPKTFQDYTVEKPAGDASATPDHVKFTNWALDYSNDSTFPVQIVDGSYTGESTSTSFGYAQWIQDGATQTGRFLATGTFKRYYWALDPNYDVTTAGKTYPTIFTDGTLTHITDATNAITSSSNDYITYCFENTMEYNQMTLGNTTSVVLKGVYHKGNNTVDKHLVALGSWIEEVPDDLPLKEEITSGRSGIAIADLFEEDEETVLKAFNLTENVEVDFYYEGNVFYTVPIRHFDDTETPKPNPMSSVNSYTPVHRGRFGLVRNNWYEVNINKVTGIGDPVPTPDPDDPDDPKDKQYMDVKINILSWAKRSYTYDL